MRSSSLFLFCVCVLIFVLIFSFHFVAALFSQHFIFLLNIKPMTTFYYFLFYFVKQYYSDRRRCVYNNTHSVYAIQ